MDRDMTGQGWAMVHKALGSPEAQTLMSPEQLHSELSRLKTRLARVQARGGAYRKVDMSYTARELLARLEAGSLLSTQVH